MHAAAPDGYLSTRTKFPSGLFQVGVQEGSPGGRCRRYFFDAFGEESINLYDIVGQGLSAYARMCYDWTATPSFTASVCTLCHRTPTEALPGCHSTEANGRWAY